MYLIQAEDSRRSVARRAAKMGSWPITVAVHIGPFVLSERNFEACLKHFAGYDVIIADPVISVIDIDDLNDAKQVRRGVGLWQRLARETGAAIILVHHVKKGDGEGQDMLLGSGQFQATPDNFVVWGQSPKGAPPGSKTLTWTGRDLPRIEPEVILLNTSTLTWERVGTVGEVKARAKESSPEDKARAELVSSIDLYAALPTSAEAAVTVETLLDKVDLKEYRIRELLRTYPKHFAYTGKPQGRGATRQRWYRGPEEPKAGVENE